APAKPAGGLRRRGQRRADARRRVQVRMSKPMSIDTMLPAGKVAAKTAATFPVAVGERELRLDLFRGLALWLIYIDHLPTSVLTWFTIRNYGFSDATEIFIFISGYTGAFVYARAMGDRGVVVASARIFKRVWQIYAAH